LVLGWQAYLGHEMGWAVGRANCNTNETLTLSVSFAIFETGLSWNVRTTFRVVEDKVYCKMSLSDQRTASFDNISPASKNLGYSPQVEA
jgi:hypothetical protein